MMPGISAKGGKDNSRGREAGAPAATNRTNPSRRATEIFSLRIHGRVLVNFCRLDGIHWLVILVLCVVAARTSAATLADYRRRVSEAAASIEQLQSTYDDEDPFQREQFVAATIARVRDQLPEKET